MPANTNPIYSLTPNIGRATWLPATTANTKSDGTGTIGTDILLAFTGGSNGSIVEYLRAYPVASVASTNTTATVLRVFISSVGTGATTNANTLLFAEVACPLQAADAPTAATTPIIVPLGIRIPTGYFVLVSMHHAAAANTAWEIQAIGGDY